jgi:hypothetical protein
MISEREIQGLRKFLELSSAASYLSKIQDILDDSNVRNQDKIDAIRELLG